MLKTLLISSLNQLSLSLALSFHLCNMHKLIISAKVTSIWTIYHMVLMLPWAFKHIINFTFHMSSMFKHFVFTYLNVSHIYMLTYFYTCFQVHIKSLKHGFYIPYFISYFSLWCYLPLSYKHMGISLSPIYDFHLCFIFSCNLSFA